jgi:hypothetical protein
VGAETDRNISHLSDPVRLFWYQDLDFFVSSLKIDTFRSFVHIVRGPHGNICSTSTNLPQGLGVSDLTDR